MRTECARALTLKRRQVMGAVFLVALSIPAIDSPARAATINVNTAADQFGSEPDQCALREAIQAATTNAPFGGCPGGSASQRDTIRLRAATYQIQLPGGSENLNNTGDFDLLSDVAITGAGRTATRVVGGTDLDRVFEITNGAAVKISRLAITGGEGDVGAGCECGGGIIVVSGSLALNNSVVEDNQANSAGGGIASFGILTVTRSIIRDNRALGPPIGQINGGGIAKLGENSRLTLTRSTVSNNRASFTGGGIGLDPRQNPTMIRDSVIKGNFAYDGGGIGQEYQPDGALLHIERSNVANNHAEAGGGGVYARTATQIYSSTLTGNEAGRGGGASGESPAASFSVYNSTVSGNSASLGGGGLALGNSPLTLSRSTVVTNSAPNGGGILAQGGTGAQGVHLYSSILANNSGGEQCKAESADYESGGHNLIEGACPVTRRRSDISGRDPRLGPLRMNGGPTATRALSASSPARDESADCGQRLDQRGAPRAENCDIGAYEFVRCLGSRVNRVGTPRADRLTGGAGVDVFLLLGGNDVAIGRGAADKMCGGGGRDRLSGGTGADKLSGGAGVDRLTGGGGQDLCIGGPGRDVFASCERRRS